MHTREELAYLAGIVDGEGTIQIIKQSNKGSVPYHTAALYVTNSDMRLLEWIQSRFGGNITKARQHVGKNWRPVYRIQIYGDLSLQVVKLIEPFLVLKREQAQLFIEFRDRIRQPGKGRPRALTSDERMIRAQLAECCQRLNLRGRGSLGQEFQEPSTS